MQWLRRNLSQPKQPTLSITRGKIQVFNGKNVTQEVFEGCDFSQTLIATRISFIRHHRPCVFVVLESIVSGCTTPFSIFWRRSDSEMGPIFLLPPKKPVFKKYQSADIGDFLSLV